MLSKSTIFAGIGQGLTGEGTRRVEWDEGKEESLG